ncbi:MAG: Hpt domain-containing protein [Candidatus Magnetobacterium sp. LHC-1]|nr:Hpt domain-containing protein [Nitrospirota bacterium]
MIVKIQDDEDLREIIPQYLSRRRDEIADMKKAMADNDMEKLRDMGHKLKGSGGGYGFDYLTEVGMIIEKAAKAADTTTLATHVQQLAEFLEQVEVVYE